MKVHQGLSFAKFTVFRRTNFDPFEPDTWMLASGALIEYAIHYA